MAEVAEYATPTRTQYAPAVELEMSITVEHVSPLPDTRLPKTVGVFGLSVRTGATWMAGCV